MSFNLVAGRTHTQYNNRQYFSLRTPRRPISDTPLTTSPSYIAPGQRQLGDAVLRVPGRRRDGRN